MRASLVARRATLVPGVEERVAVSGDGHARMRTRAFTRARVHACACICARARVQEPRARACARAVGHAFVPGLKPGCTSTRVASLARPGVPMWSRTPVEELSGDVNSRGFRRRKSSSSCALQGQRKRLEPRVRPRIVDANPSRLLSCAMARCHLLAACLPATCLPPCDPPAEAAIVVERRKGGPERGRDRRDDVAAPSSFGATTRTARGRGGDEWEGDRRLSWRGVARPGGRTRRRSR